MSNFLIDEEGNQIWYDLKSDIKDQSKNIWCFVVLPSKQYFYVRPHRENGPAIIYTDGYEDYCIHGKYHREDGPALYHFVYAWYLYDTNYPFDKWCEILNKTQEEVTFLKLKYNV